MCNLDTIIGLLCMHIHVTRLSFMYTNWKKITYNEYHPLMCHYNHILRVIPLVCLGTMEWPMVFFAQWPNGWNVSVV
jgi:hypothetical protein